MLAFDATLQTVLADGDRPHEDVPRGVPVTHGWYSRPSRGAWNDAPAGWTHVCGWGIAFWRPEATRGALDLRRLQVWAVADAGWVKLQDGPVGGAAFAPDFVHNINAPAVITAGAGSDHIEWAQDAAFHFWPKCRTPIPQGCRGFLVLVQAKCTGAMLLNLGLDYWRTESAQWAPGAANCKGAGVGRLRIVAPEWAWHGWTTASAQDLAAF